MMKLLHSENIMELSILIITLGYIFNEKVLINPIFFGVGLIQMIYFIKYSKNTNLKKIKYNSSNFDWNLCIIMLLFSITLITASVFAVNKDISLQWSENYIKCMFIPSSIIWIIYYNDKVSSVALKRYINIGICAGLFIISLIILYKNLILGELRPCVDYISNNPNPTAGFILLLIPFAMLNNVIKNIYLNLMFIMLVSTSLFITGSRGAIISYIFIVILYFFIRKPYRKLNYLSNKFIVKLLLAFIVIIAYLGTHISDNNIMRFEELFNKPGNLIEKRVGGDRIYLWRSSIEMIKDYPFTGIGLKNFNQVYKEEGYMDPNAREPNLTTAHNTFLNFFVETGVLGGLSFILLVGYQMKYLFHDIKKDDFILALFLSIFGMCIHGMVDYVLIKIYWQMYWFLTGAVWLYIYKRKSDFSY